MRREWKRGLLSAIQLWASEAGKRAKDVINMVMYIIACVGSQEGPESYLVWATPVNSRGNRNSERLSGWPSVTRFTAKPVLEPWSPACQSSVPTAVA